MTPEPQDWAERLQEIYSDLCRRQERLGSEFEKVWADNLDSLYEE